LIQTTGLIQNRTTKVEGMLAIARLATFHPTILIKNQLHSMIRALVAEVKNLRSAVSRSAIFTIGELFAKLGPHLEPVSNYHYYLSLIKLIIVRNWTH
jgi:hypothetical protein